MVFATIVWGQKFRDPGNKTIFL